MTNIDSIIKDSNSTYQTIYNSETDTIETILHTPSKNVLEKMEAMRRYFKINNMPFVVFPKSNKSICVRNNKEVNEPNERILYKSIIETTNINRRGNILLDPNGLCYDFFEKDIEEVNVDFNPNKIKENYDKYEVICKMSNTRFEFKPWNNNMIK